MGAECVLQGLCKARYAENMDVDEIPELTRALKRATVMPYHP